MASSGISYPSPFAMAPIRDILPSTPLLQLEFAGYLPPNRNVEAIQPMATVVKSKASRFPQYIYALDKQIGNAKENFGVFVGEMVKSMLMQITHTFDQRGTVPTDWRAAAWNMWNVAMNGQAQDFAAFTKMYPWFESLDQYLRQAFAGNPQLELNTQYSYQNVYASPDIVGPEYLLDIKTISSIDSLDKILIQLCADAALARQNGKVINFIGVLFTMQRSTFYIDIRNWDHRRFLERMVEGATNTLYQARLSSPEDEVRDIILSNVGTHYARGGASVSQACTTLNPRVPWQMYIQTQASGYAIGDDELQRAAAVISSKGLKVFSHAPLSINLCSVTKNNVQHIINDVRYSRIMGLGGSVVHMGAANDADYATAINNMEYYVRLASAEASEATPLLLETSAGEGRDVCCDPTELAGFYARFSEDERKRIKLCVDTCHVFSAGFHPMLWLQTWLKYYPPSSIKLIHYNDSKTRRGGCNDSHAFVGNGFIGLAEMYEVFMWATSNDVSCVIE